MKRIIAFMLIFIVVFSLSACSGSQPSENSGDDIGPSDSVNFRKPSETPDPTPSEDEAPVQPNTPIAMPTDLGGIEPGESWQFGEFGYEPQVITTATAGDWSFTVSVPTIPEELETFAKERGDYYVLIYQENQNQGLERAYLFFYQDYFDLTLMREKTTSGPGDILSPGRNKSFPDAQTQFPYLFSCDNTTVQGSWSSMYIYYFWNRNHTSLDWNVQDGTVSKQWDFTDTSFTPPAEYVQIMIEAVSAI
ncbi:MAG: hypothetical protein ACK5MU_04365 [Candidatus Saccharimonadales bacterium]